MPAPESKGAGKPEAILAEAKKLYKASKFKNALAHFRMVVLKCKCNKELVASAKELGMNPKEMLFSTCHCKDFDALSLAPNADKLAMYNLATKPCTCGSGMAPCNLSTHIGALEGIAASYDKLGAHDKAYRYASLQIVMAPNALEGYLRMAKAMRLMDTSESPITRARCVWIYRQASQSVRTYGNKDLGMLKVLNSLLRRDIIASLPFELRTMILQKLSCTDLCRCMRVSKTWNTTSRDPCLWRNLEFVKHWSGSSYRPFRPNVLNDILLNRARKLARSLIIHSIKDFGIDATKLGAIIKALPQLESLSLACSGNGYAPDRSSPTLKEVFRAVVQGTLTGLKTLHLDGFEFPRAGLPTTSLLPAASMTQTLQELIITNIEGIEVFTAPDGLFSSAVWPKLEKLEFSGSNKNPVSNLSLWADHPNKFVIDFPRLITAVPALKDVSFSDVLAKKSSSETAFGPATWDRLERFVLRNFLWSRDSPQFEMAAFPRLPASLRSLEVPGHCHQSFLCDYRQLALNCVDREGVPFTTSFERLEHLRLSGYKFHHVGSPYHTLACLIYHWFTEKLAPSVSNGTLKSIDIPFDGLVLEEFDKVLDKNAICTLSCNALSCYLDQSGLLSSEGKELVAWLDGFPNLTTVGVFPDDPRVGSLMISKLLSEENKIDTIYTNALSGVYRDEALKMASKKGITIIHAKRVPEPVLEPLGQQPTA